MSARLSRRLRDADHRGRWARDAIQGDPAHPMTQGFLCAKVAKYLDRVYSPDRVLYPMRRVAPKGAGGEAAFQRISWDEALNEIVGRLKQTERGVRAGGDSAVFLRRQPRRAERRLDGHALLPSPGRIAAAAHHLRHDGRRRHRLDVRQERSAPSRSSFGTRSTSSRGARTSTATTFTCGRSSKKHGAMARSWWSSIPTARARRGSPTGTSRSIPGTDVALALGTDAHHCA